MSQPNPPPPLPPSGLQPPGSHLPPPGSRPPAPRSSCGTWAKGLGIGCAVLAGLVLAGLAMLGLAVEQGYLPDTVAQADGEIPTPVLAKLRELGVIEPGERVLWFYSAGMFSIEEDGNLFTESRVISYQTVDEKFELFQASWDEVAEIDFEAGGSDWEDSTITVTRSDESWLVLWVSPMEGKDHEFHEKLVQTWESGRGGELPAD